MSEPTEPGLRSHLIRIARAIASEEVADSPSLQGDGPEYVLESRLGDGGEGVVWLAEQTALKRRVALKSPHPEHEEAFWMRARAWGQLDHPNIVPVYDLATGRVEDRLAPVLAMKHVKGRPWSRILAEPGSMVVFDQIDILLKVADALAYAHSRGVAHCDVKPSNVLVGEFGEVLLADWGMLRICDPREETLRAMAAELPVVDGGTEGYMAPEQSTHDQASIGIRSDVYALGMILRQLLGGNAAGRPGNPCDPPPTPGLDEVAARATRDNPAERHASAAEFAEDLRERMRGHYSRRKGEELAGRAEATLASLPPAGAPRRHEALRECEHLLDESLRAWGENPRALRLREEVRQTTAETLRAEGALAVARAEAMRVSEPSARDRLLGAITRDEDRIRRRATQLRASIAVSAAAALLLVVVWGSSVVRAEKDKARQAQLQLAVEMGERKRLQDAARIEAEQARARQAAEEGQRLAELSALQERETRLAEAVRERVPPPSSIDPPGGLAIHPSVQEAILPELGELEEARASLARKFPSALPNPHRALLFARADAALATGDDPASIAAAEETYKRLASDNPSDPEPLIGLAVALARRGELEAADASSKKALELAERSESTDGGVRARALSVAAQIQRELGNDEIAREYDDRSLGILQEAWERDTLDFAEELTRVGHTGDAIHAAKAWFDIALSAPDSARNPGQVARGLELLAEAQNDAGDPDGAIATLDMLIAAFGADTASPFAIREPVWLGLKARVLTGLGNHELAGELYRQAIAGFEHAPPAMRRDYLTVLSGQALALLEAGRPAEAEAMAREHLSKLLQFQGPDHPHVATARLNLAAMVSAQGRQEEAEALAREALEGFQHFRAPDSANVAAAHATLAAIQSRAGRHDEALQTIRRAICLRGRADSKPSRDGALYWISATTAALRSGRQDLACAAAIEGFDRAVQFRGDYAPESRLLAANMVARLRSPRMPPWSESRSRLRKAAVWMHRSLCEGPNQALDLPAEAYNQVIAIRALLESDSETGDIGAAEAHSLMKRALLLSGLADPRDGAEQANAFYASCAARLGAAGEAIPEPLRSLPSDARGGVLSRDLATALDAVAPFPDLEADVSQPPLPPEGGALIGEFLAECP